MREVLRRQGDAVAWVAERLADEATLSQIVDRVLACSGRCVCLGMGKMGAVARKVAATLASTGCPALFVQPSEALHGDLGMITRQDVVWAFSYSGETDEVLRVVETVRPWGVPVLALTAGHENSLARLADWVLDVQVPREAIDAWPVPTCSTTATLALADAVAMTVMQRRGFSAEDFAVLHPGGSLGRRLRLRVRDVMRAGAELPVILPTATFRDALIEMSRKSLGVTMIAGNDRRLVGLLTDGDVRRSVERHPNPLNESVTDFMTRSPRVCVADDMAAVALALMESHRVTVMPVVDADVLVGIIHFHDLVQARLL